MKNKILIPAVLLFCSLACCKKESPSTIPSAGYTSMADFLSKNAPTKQTYSVDANTGGQFTSPQGTVVQIPPKAFVNKNSLPVTGTVTIQFLDIYKKSDMLFCDMTTNTDQGKPIKSGGEFFFNALSAGTPLALSPGKKIKVIQPASLTGAVDPAMKAFVKADTAGFGPTSVWTISGGDSVLVSPNSYVFNLYTYRSQANKGSWSNSDNPYYFSAYTQTNLAVIPTDDLVAYQTNVYLCFKNIASMVHVYSNSGGFPYMYAPVGLSCTIVAVGVKDGNVYSSFTPITIGANQSVHFTLNQTTADAFKAQLTGLN
jgi:hypothetical protein